MNDLTEGLTANVKLFVVDTSLFFVVRGDVQTSANDLINDLKIINKFAFKFKIKFNK